MFTLNWYYSKTVRQATDMKRQVRMLLNEQRDLLNEKQIQNLEAAIGRMGDKIRENPGKKEIAAEMNQLEKVANENLKPYAAGTIRENVKEILVAITTILAFTTFFLQLTKIPTGSMQPTLFGITDENLLDDPDVKIPGPIARLKDYWIWGVQYKFFVAPVDGEFEEAAPVRTVFPFVKMQKFKFAGQWHTVWFPGDSFFYPGTESQRPRAVVRRGPIKRGEYVFNTKIVAGDHLLVDRISYNFRKPTRGEIIVFKTRGIPGLQQDQLYIKRLVGLPGERVQVGDDRHLIIDGNRLDAATPRFEMVYTPDDEERKRFPYRGHVNDKVAQTRYQFHGGLAPVFPDENAMFQVRPGHMMAMGDNTLNSQDSRAWGDFPAKNLIGKCWFIYWPFTDRFGWGYR